MIVTPELLVEDLSITIDFYVKELGFKVMTIFPDNEPFFAIIKNDDAQIMLYSRKQFAEEIPEFSNVPMGGSFVLYINVENIESLYKNLKNVSKVVQTLHKTNYGTTEFTCEDPNGYKLMFAENKK